MFEMKIGTSPSCVLYIYKQLWYKILSVICTDVLARLETRKAPRMSKHTRRGIVITIGCVYGTDFVTGLIFDTARPAFKT